VAEQPREGAALRACAPERGAPRIVAHGEPRCALRRERGVERELEQQERRIGDALQRGVVERQPTLAQLRCGGDLEAAALEQRIAQHAQPAQVHLGDLVERLGVGGSGEIFGGGPCGARIIVGFHHSSMKTPQM
jgi:hypothetical protein